MTDSARGGDQQSAVPSMLRHPLANVQAIRELWTPLMGWQLAARFSTGQLYLVLSNLFLIWGFIGGVVVALIGALVRGSGEGPVFGITLGISVIIVGILLGGMARSSQRRVALMYLPYVQELLPKMRLGRLTALLRQGSAELLELVRLHPEAFPKPR